MIDNDERAVRAERAAAAWKRAAKEHRRLARSLDYSLARLAKLCDTWPEIARALGQERDAARAENARLREAAVIIDNHAYCTACSYDQPCRHTPTVDQARAVLGLTAEQQQPRGDPSASSGQADGDTGAAATIDEQCRCGDWLSGHAAGFRCAYCSCEAFKPVTDPDQ